MNVFFDYLAKILRTANAQALFTDEPPGLVQILFVVGRVFNILIISAGVVLVALLFISSYKFAMSQGDPKAIDGAKRTLTYAILGFILVIGFNALLSVLFTAILGPGQYGVGSFISQLEGVIAQFNAFLNIRP